GSPPCVVKQLKPANNDPSFIREARRLFNTEAETLEKLGKHEQIPQLLAYFEEDKQFFLVQEFIEGRSLHDELKAPLPEVSDLDHQIQEQILEELQNIDAPHRDKQISEVEVLKILKDVLEVLEFVHSEGVIHRDIKPDNLIRRKKDQKIVLIDFGAVRVMQDVNAKLTANEKGESRFTVTIGTLGYMPSEQCAGRPNYSSDIYALGMVSIKALTGYEPTNLPIDPITGELVWRDKAKVSNGLAMVLTRMVRYQYTQRYQSVREVNQGIMTFVPTTEIERQSTSSKIVKSTILMNSNHLVHSNNYSKSTIDLPSMRQVASTSPSSQSNSGVLLLFGGLLSLVAVIAAVALPAMMRNNQRVIVNNAPPISKPIPRETPSPEASNNPNTSSTSNSEPVNQVLTVEANKESLVIPNKILGNAIHTYKINAKAGQLLSTAVTGNGVLLSILNEQGFGIPGTVNVPSTELDIPTDGTYVVQLRVIAGASETPYQLKVLLKDKAIATPLTPLTTPSSLPTPNTGLPTSPSPSATPSQVPSP
ncbi:MAG: protein kinase domain-containing protein, partial [Pseudanabaena sp.]